MLVPRLYDVTAGVVRVDGHDVRDLTQDSLHAAIGAVTQDPTCSTTPSATTSALPGPTPPTTSWWPPPEPRRSTT